MALRAFLAACLAVLWLPAADPGIRAHYVGGTVPGIAPKSGTKLDLTASDVMTFRSAKAQIRIPYGRINSLEYGQNVSRRYAAAILISPVLLLSKSRKHFVSI